MRDQVRSLLATEQKAGHAAWCMLPSSLLVIPAALCSNEEPGLSRESRTERSAMLSGESLRKVACRCGVSSNCEWLANDSLWVALACREVFQACYARLPRKLPLKFALPGAERQDSVYNGFQVHLLAITRGVFRSHVVGSSRAS